MSVYIVKYQPTLESDFQCPEASEPIIYDIYDSEEEARKIIEEFPFMLYNEHPVK